MSKGPDVAGGRAYVFELFYLSFWFHPGYFLCWWRVLVTFFCAQPSPQQAGSGRMSRSLIRLHSLQDQDWRGQYRQAYEQAAVRPTTDEDTWMPSGRRETGRKTLKDQFHNLLVPALWPQPSVLEVSMARGARFLNSRVGGPLVRPYKTVFRTSSFGPWEGGLDYKRGLGTGSLGIDQPYCRNRRSKKWGFEAQTWQGHSQAWVSEQAPNLKMVSVEAELGKVFLSNRISSVARLGRYGKTLVRNIHIYIYMPACSLAEVYFWNLWFSGIFW